MFLTDVQVTNFKSIDDSGEVAIDPAITVLVGQNESGKTAFLQAIHKARPLDTSFKYSVTDDYPRKGLTAYEKQHSTAPALVAKLTYKLDIHDIARINSDLNFEVLDELEFRIEHKYAGTVVHIDIPETLFVKHLLQCSSLPADVTQKCSPVVGIKQLIVTLKDMDLNAESTTFLNGLTERFSKLTWENWLSEYIWKCLIVPYIPQFLYFDDYYLLPGKVNLPSLLQSLKASEQSAQALEAGDKTVLGLLRMAGVELEAITETIGYENIKAKLEAISNSVTDKVFEYWRQNQELDVEFDIRPDVNDKPPFNVGNNLYIRIRHRRHRVTVPFSQRSKGFIWFFSFIVWFESIQQQTGTQNGLVLLLDEPGLSLHALAQADFLHYIDDLAKSYQILYTTHSPFMVHSDRLNQVRMVEDRLGEGTKISDNVSGSDPKTIFPLQAALGYTIAQNLFISKRNLLVEGPGDLVYLKIFSSILEKAGRAHLRDDVTIVPVGGLDKVATFIALLRGNELEIVVMHDFAGKADARIESLVRDNIIKKKQVLNYALFRNAPNKAIEAALLDTDVEDLITTSLYLKLFGAAYADKLSSAVIETALPPGVRIVDRINGYLFSNSVLLRPSGGYNHYLIASHLASNPSLIGKVDTGTLNRFEQLFNTVNSLFDEYDKMVIK